jgi:hypothetical protein
MKLRASLVLVAALMLGGGAFAWRATQSPRHSAQAEPELRWLQREFALSDDVMRRIDEMHRSYTGECEKMCAELRVSADEVSRLMTAEKRTTPQLEAALARRNQLTADCQRRMVEHFYAVAKEMPPAAGKRYLALMTPVVTHPEGGWMKMTPE